jgi:hypothetical protein
MDTKVGPQDLSGGNTMKKLSVLLLGFGLALGTIATISAQDTKKKESTGKKEKKKKKSEPTKKEG